MATTATPIEAMQVIGPEIAKISNFVGQETPDDFIRKIAQVLSSVWAWSTDGNVVAGNRANASINPALHLNILKSKMGGH
ncbi:9741_t:CDS:2 [Entrophospora sp. SA101]|nr:8100_t:CDS:2 [Entrophospora sp. SA101]CAJ0915842.1 9741_t:CDS:2 [Entrophospora sp. SA101]